MDTPTRPRPARPLEFPSDDEVLKDPRALFDALLVTNDWAFGVGNLTVALHALCSAMYFAGELRDDLRLAEVQFRFWQQADAVKAQAANFLLAPAQARSDADEAAFRAGARAVADLRQRFQFT